MNRYLLLLILPGLACGQSGYTAEKTIDGGVEIVHLADAAHGVEVSIVPSVGNRAYELKVRGKNLLYSLDPAALVAAGSKGLNGIPFLAPWANRMAGAGFWADGKRYAFNPDLGSVHIDPNGIAIHGMLTASTHWEVTEVSADANSAHVTSSFRFWKYPDLMANWPFAQEYEMTYRLAGGVLEVSTTIKNLSAEPMPVAIGFHPYFQIPGVPRSEASAHIAARLHVETDPQLVATGATTANRLPEQISLKDHTLDDGFTDLVRGGDGRATFSVRAGDKEIDVIYGPKYQVAVVYAPPGKDYVCFEPMTAITNGVNLAHEGKYPALQMLDPGATWRESFWVRSSGF